MAHRGSPEAGAGSAMTESLPGEEGGARTRERILDVSLDLFVDQGFDKTSVRQIAEALGITKAAIYYYFTSKDDILMALHLRLHEIGGRAIAKVAEIPFSLGSWTSLFDQLIDEMLANRKIFLMHERNRAAFENLHRQEHDESHQGMEDIFRKLISDDTVPLRVRFRIVSAIGTLMTGLVFTGELLSEVSVDEVRILMREAVADLMAGRSGSEPGQDLSSGAGAPS